jgi:hypothetical protein
MIKFIIIIFFVVTLEYQASFTSDGIDKGRASYCGNVKLKIKHLIVEISLDRDELDVDFGTELHYDKDKSNYEEYYDDKFDHQVVWQLITGKIYTSWGLCVFLVFIFGLGIY